MQSSASVGNTEVARGVSDIQCKSHRMFATHNQVRCVLSGMGPKRHDLLSQQTQCLRELSEYVVHRVLVI